jgi:hypothetical protein
MGRRVGLLTDAFALESFPLALLRYLRQESVFSYGE